mmetsp:Transcript_12671/g.40000  ORF Transcript_12671/g.40000 Transcript_12671/m.40000 type:complete len:208 (-) Transcript_12671:521-1144(-)
MQLSTKRRLISTASSSGARGASICRDLCHMSTFSTRPTASRCALFSRACTTEGGCSRSRRKVTFSTSVLLWLEASGLEADAMESLHSFPLPTFTPSPLVAAFSAMEPKPDSPYPGRSDSPTRPESPRSRVERSLACLCRSTSLPASLGGGGQAPPGSYLPPGAMPSASAAWASTEPHPFTRCPSVSLLRTTAFSSVRCSIADLRCCV